MNEVINVCLACDDNYSKYAGVVIASILANADTEDNLTFYILDGGIAQENKQKIQELKSIKNCEINFIEIDESLFEEYKKVKTHKYITLATYYRLKLPSMLLTVPRVIYLDCDMVVESSLKELYNKNLSDKPLAGVHDIKLKNILENPTYVNAGMLVMDLDNMRKQNLEEKFLQWTKEHINTIKTGDQEIINEVCRGNILVIEDEWNVQSSNFTNRSSYTNTPKIVHFTAVNKPWHWASFSYHRDLYFKYLQLTPWKLSEKELIHWTKDNQKASLLAYLKYRPFFFLRPRFYKALWLTYFTQLFACIFSIKDYGQTHRIMKILGIKIKFPKKEYAQKQKENPFYYYQKNNIDITTLPKATGQIRDIQLANLALLKELDYVCKQNNLQYWLDGGTQLGAIRHRGFIPWDDDIDVGMIRDDYEKIIEAFRKTSKNSNIFADYYRDKKNPAQIIIKVQHKICKYLFVDIFPFDFYGKTLNKEEQLEKSNYIKTLISELKKNSSYNMNNEEIRTRNSEIMKSKILSIPNTEINTDIVWGIDFHHQWKNWFTEYNVLYPLKTIEFENQNFPCINKPNEYLTRLYGNYMSYPKKIGYGHSAYVNLTEQDKKVIEELKNSIL